MALKRHRRFGGLHSMGPVAVRPLAAYTILTDRADGTLWVLQHDATLEHVVLSDDTAEALARSDKYVYAARSGPVVGTSRLLVRGGRLGYEPLDEPASQSKPLTRIGNVSRRFLEIKSPAGHLPPAALAFEEHGV